jgi:AcrR family transcriptional regulator
MTLPVAVRPRRADAVRNRERVVAAAAAVFGERGTEAGVPEVAARAGVGKATVYRSFPTKEHLIAAVVIDRLGEFEQRARDQRDAPDAWAALVDLFADGARRHCADRTLNVALAAGVAPDLLEDAPARMWAAVAVIVERAQAQGSMRRGVGVAELRVLWGGAARMLTADGIRDPDVWSRYAVLVVGALRAEG